MNPQSTNNPLVDFIYAICFLTIGIITPEVLRETAHWVLYILQAGAYFSTILLGIKGVLDFFGYKLFKRKRKE